MGKLVLKTAIGTYPHTVALKDGRVTSDKLTLEFTEFDPPNRAFRPMANELAFDLSEMAIVTYFVARAMNKPLVMLPVTMMCQPELALLVCAQDSSLRTPEDLQGKTIGARSYSQTTVTWVRGILHQAYGLDLAKLRWRTLEPSHVDGFQDPPSAVRLPAGTSLFDALKSGEIDAAVIAWEALKTPGIRPVFDDAAAREAAWSRKYGITPVNHVLNIATKVLHEHPWVPDEVARMFEMARKAAATPSAEDGQSAGPWGLEANRPAFQAMADFAYEQGLAPRRFTVDELFQA